MDLSALGKGDKKYGLIIRKDLKPATVLKPSAFSIDSDDDKDEKTVVMKRMNEARNKFVKMQVQMNIEKALNEDPHCFDYDEVYDREHKKEEEVIVKKDLKPKYISGLVKAAETRKKRYEIITEKKIQKERDAEGDKFEDKECFVSNTYKEKLKERKEAEERDRRQEALEELMESKGEKDYTGFYQNLLEQRISRTKLTEEESIKENHKDEMPSNREKSRSPERDDRRQVHQKARGSDDESPRRHKRRRSRSRTPRKHQGRRSESSGSEESRDRRVKRSRHDRRSPKRNDDHKDRRERDDKKERKRSSPDRDLHRRSVEQKNESRKEKEVKVNEVKEEEEESKNADRKAKRNIGESLDDAKARYLARKAGNAIKPIISKK